MTPKLTAPFIFNGSLTKKAKQAKLRLPLTYKRLIVWDIYGPLYVIGKRKQQGSSNFAPRQTSPRGIFCDDQSAFSIPLGINEKKAPRNTSSPDKHDCSDNLTSYIAFPCHNGVHSEKVILLQDMVHFINWNSDRNCFFFLEEFLKNSLCWQMLNLLVGQSKSPQNCYRILQEFGIWSEKQSEFHFGNLMNSSNLNCFCIRLFVTA